jgi:L-rhamnose mutarotase
MQRMGHVVEIRPEAIEEYERIHADVWPEVLAALTRANVHNYSIFRHGELLFSYWEYMGEDFVADMKVIADDPVSQKWDVLTSQMLRAPEDAPPGVLTLPIPEIFHLD